jgi:hypothetical protein
VALGYWSRNGIKAEVALRWRGSADGAVPGAQDVVDKVVSAFADGTLPSRLPYKLREATPVLEAIRSGAAAPGEVERLRHGLLLRALDERPPGRELLEKVLELWRAGERSHPSPASPERSVEGLLLCRSLAARGGAEEER